MKKIIIAVLVLGLVTFVFADNKKFADKNIGIEFMYKSDYTIKSSDEGHFYSIELASADGTKSIVAQVFNGALNNNVKKKYMEAVEASMKKDGFSIAQSKDEKVTLPIKTLYKSPGTETSRYFRQFEKEGQVLTMDIYIFNGGSSNDKGFSISFIAEGDDYPEEFETFKSTLTIY